MTTRRLFEALFAVALFVIAVRRTVDPDLWWHLRTGEIIVADGIPRYDVFSFTVPDHRWITHEWLSQVFMWLVYEGGGLAGLIVVFAVVIALSFWLVYRRCAGRPYLAAFVVLLAAFAAAITWGARPQMFNLLFFAAFLYLLEGVRGGALTRRALWWLPPLTALWANLHSGYLLGVVLLLVYVVGESVPRWQMAGWGLSRAAWRRLVMITPLALLAALLNPNGYHLWTYPFETLGSGAMQSYIQEWQPPDFHLVIFWPFAALLAAGVLAFIFSGRRPGLTDLLLFGGTAGAGLLSARHIPLFALAAAPVVCRALAATLATTRLQSLVTPKPAVKPGRAMTVLNWLLLLLVASAGLLWTLDRMAGNEAAITELYPVAAVDYLEAAGLGEARGYNAYEWGGYLIWRGLPVFVDGRADVYGDAFLHSYRWVLDVTSRWGEPLDDYDVQYALLQRGTALATLLEESEAWVLTYDDALAVVYERVE
jgi:hypothetical protein